MNELAIKDLKPQKKSQEKKRIFHYVVQDNYNRVIKGLLLVKDITEARRILHSFGYDKILSLRELSPLEVSWIHFWHRVSDKELAIFTREMAEMFKSGLPIMRVLELLASESINPRLALIAMTAKEYLRNGLPLSKAFAEFPDIFSDLYVGMLRLGEATGEFDAILSELADYLTADFELKAKLKSSLTYPFIVLTFAILLVWSLVNFIFPKFTAIIQGLDLELPIYTKILMKIAHISTKPEFLIPFLLTLILGVTLFRALYRGSRTFRKLIESILSRLPVIGGVFKKLLLARFAKAIVFVFKSGLPLMIGIDYIKVSMDSAIIKDLCDKIKATLKEGGTLSQAIADSHFFPPMFKAVVEAGEQVGELEGMLSKLADLYDFEVKTEMGILVNLLEPLIIFILGGLVGFVLLGVFSPLMTLISNIK